MEASGVLFQGTHQLKLQLLHQLIRYTCTGDLCRWPTLAKT